MTLARLKPSPTSDQIEDAYRMLLRKTWLAVPVLVALVVGIIGKTGLLVHPDGSPKSSGLYDTVGVFYVVLFPIVVIALAFLRGRSELRTIAFGRLVWWQIIAFGLILGALAQLSGRILFPFFGGRVVAPYDPSPMVTVLNIIDTVFVTPLGEEAIFRVVLQTYLQRYGTAIAVVGITLLFTLFHLPFVDRIPSHDALVETFVLIPISALILSVARRYSGSLLLCLVIHMTDNSLGFLGPPDAQLPGCC